ncbi:polar amino acid transport system substrate-binding protein [Desulfobotulus alkaliphilus]|uniref:Polar amino acid transport system substrate-binding protein n=1 Tax=Desulfobotulus alkaliphilus TaxID=622671 RepID=A0A562RCX7_9BACT|nr:transporter substrate-binding domain-containing protein [Desulfobotulus alkaliphilus]TWI66911.1 polar amino acid transport system substrate-binding protein [Desulfobotulus alkaliphilus]
MHRFFLPLMLILILPLSSPARTLDMLTDDFPPYSFQENGRISGICMDVIQSVFQDTAYDFHVQLFPFARAYAATRDGKNIFEFCVARTPEREELFHWIGPVGPSYEGLIALSTRKDIRIESDRDMAVYRIGTVIEDVVDQHLSARQKELGLTLDKTSSYRQNMRKLMAGRMDIWAGNIIAAFQLAKDLGHDPEELRVVYAFPDLYKDLYLVTGKKSDPDLVEDLQRIFENFVEKGKYEKIKEQFIREQTSGYSDEKRE